MLVVSRIHFNYNAHKCTHEQDVTPEQTGDWLAIIFQLKFIKHAYFYFISDPLVEIRLEV